MNNKNDFTDLWQSPIHYPRLQGRMNSPKIHISANFFQSEDVVEIVDNFILRKSHGLTDEEKKRVYEATSLRFNVILIKMIEAHWYHEKMLLESDFEFAFEKIEEISGQFQELNSFLRDHVKITEQNFYFNSFDYVHDTILQPEEIKKRLQQAQELTLKVHLELYRYLDFIKNSNFNLKEKTERSLQRLRYRLNLADTEERALVQQNIEHLEKTDLNKVPKFARENKGRVEFPAAILIVELEKIKKYQTPNKTHNPKRGKLEDLILAYVNKLKEILEHCPLDKDKILEILNKFPSKKSAWAERIKEIKAKSRESSPKESRATKLSKAEKNQLDFLSRKL